MILFTYTESTKVSAQTPLCPECKKKYVGGKGLALKGGAGAGAIFFASLFIPLYLVGMEGTPPFYLSSEVGGVVGFLIFAQPKKHNEIG